MKSEKYILWIYGQPVEVDEAIYKAYIRGERKMRYFESDLKTEHTVYYPDGTIKRLVPSKEDSFDRLVDENYIQFADDSAAVEDIIVHNEEINQLRAAMDSLSKKQKDLLYLRYWQSVSQAEVAKILGTTQQSNSYQERKILSLLKKSLNN